MSRQVHVDVYSDLICPWCLIGKRNLSQALAELRQTDPDLQVSVAWHSVQLIPGVPDEGWDYKAFYLNRLGSAENVRLRQGQVREAAARAGVDVHFERITRFPSTTKGHQMLAYAAQHLAPAGIEALMDRLFAAFFLRGENMGELSTLMAIAGEFGLDAPGLQAWINAGEGLPEDVSVPGVPFFVFNRAQALSGAQPPAALLAAMRQNADHLPVASAAACSL